VGRKRPTRWQGARSTRHSSHRPDPRRRRFVEAAALEELEKIRAPLYQELDRLLDESDYQRGQPAHRCCTRQFNQMRISPLEASAIAKAFQADPDLRRTLPQVLARLRRQLPDLRDDDSRQPFDCPLLDGTRCLVHTTAKPIGCLAWHPCDPNAELEESFTRKGWQAFAQRDAANDRFYGPHWKLRVIPRWLQRVFAKELRGR